MQSVLSTAPPHFLHGAGNEPLEHRPVEVGQQLDATLEPVAVVWFSVIETALLASRLKSGRPFLVLWQGICNLVPWRL